MRSLISSCLASHRWLAAAAVALTGCVAANGGIDEQRAQMLTQAGTEHYRNEALTLGSEQLKVPTSEFAVRRDGLVNQQLVTTKAMLRSGTKQPERGPVLGPSVRDPALAQVLLTATAAANGIPVIPSQPVLARLLPGFGN